MATLNLCPACKKENPGTDPRCLCGYLPGMPLPEPQTTGRSDREARRGIAGPAILVTLVVLGVATLFAREQFAKMSPDATEATVIATGGIVAVLLGGAGVVGGILVLRWIIKSAVKQALSEKGK